MLRHSLALVVGAVLLTGCATVRSTFSEVRPDYSTLPEESMRKVANAIEQAVAEGAREPDISGQGGVVVSTPGIRQAIRTRAARHELLSDFLDTGHGLEQRNGRVKILNSKAYRESSTRRSRDRDALLIMSENNDRWAIYEGIVDASNLSPRALSAVTHIFAEERFKFLDANQKYEGPDGSVIAKSE